MADGNKEYKNLEVWYFSPDYKKTVDKKIQRTLENIKRVHGIEFKIKKVFHREDQELYYKKYFSPPRKAYMLRQRIGKGVEKDLKSRKGKGAPMLRGIIALVENNDVQYYVKRGGSGEDALKFIRNLLKNPKKTVEKCYIKAGEIEDEEMALLEAFKAKNIINGCYQTYIAVGYFFKENFGCNLRFIDVICEEEDGIVWVFEIEKELNYTAIGQAISYKYLYDKDNPGINSKPGVICGTAPKDLKESCENNQIQVFVVNEA